MAKMLLELNSDVLVYIFADWLTVADLQKLLTSYSKVKDRDAIDAILCLEHFSFCEVTSTDHHCDAFWMLDRSLSARKLTIRITDPERVCWILLMETSCLREIDFCSYASNYLEEFLNLLPKCKTLERLSLQRRTKFSSFNVVLPPLPQLRLLLIHSYQVDAQFPMQVTSGCPNLEELELEACFSRSGFASLSLDELPHLRRLHILDSDKALVTGFLRAAPNLRRLHTDIDAENILCECRHDLEECSVPFEDSTMVAPFLDNCNHLTDLMTDFSDVLAWDVACLGALSKHSHHLQTLQIKVTREGDDAAAAFMSLIPTLTSLTVLELHFMGFAWTSDEMSCVAHLSSLRRVLLGGMCKPSAELLVSVLRSNPGLQMFGSDFEGAPEAILAALAQHGCVEKVLLPCLKDLTDDAVLSLLSQCPQLAMLSVLQSKLLTSAVLHAAAAHPRLGTLEINSARITGNSLLSLVDSSGHLTKLVLYEMLGRFKDEIAAVNAAKKVQVTGW